MENKELTGRIIGAAITVHKQLGPGFLEEVYEDALAIERLYPHTAPGARVCDPQQQRQSRKRLSKSMPVEPADALRLIEPRSVDFVHPGFYQRKNPILSSSFLIS